MEKSTSPAKLIRKKSSFEILNNRRNSENPNNQNQNFLTVNYNQN